MHVDGRCREESCDSVVGQRLGEEGRCECNAAAGYVLYDGMCAFPPSCGTHARFDVASGRCVCVDSFTTVNGVCKCADTTYLSLDRASCVSADSCGEHAVARDGACQCDAGAGYELASGRCVRQSTCGEHARPDP